MLDELAAGRVSSSALVEEYLGRIDALDDDLRAFVTVTADEARAGRGASRRGASRRSNRSGRLHGLPVALKDNIATAGIRTTIGSSFFADDVPAQDAPVWQRLA